MKVLIPVVTDTISSCQLTPNAIAITIPELTLSTMLLKRHRIRNSLNLMLPRGGRFNSRPVSLDQQGPPLKR